MPAGGSAVLVCLDGAHLAYDVRKTGSANFWAQIKRLQAGQKESCTTPHYTRVVMAADYGSRHAASTAGPEPFAARAARIEYPAMVVGVFPRATGEACLQLLDKDWDQLWDNFLWSIRPHLLGGMVKERVMSVCEGQVRCAWVMCQLKLLHQPL